MDRVVDRCAGLDVGKAIVVATVRVPGTEGGRHQETRTFTPQPPGCSRWRTGW